jgi:hypothetical protein
MCVHSAKRKAPSEEERLYHEQFGGVSRGAIHERLTAAAREVMLSGGEGGMEDAPVSGGQPSVAARCSDLMALAVQQYMLGIITQLVRGFWRFPFSFHHFAGADLYFFSLSRFA